MDVAQRPNNRSEIQSVSLSGSFSPRQTGMIPGPKRFTRRPTWIFPITILSLLLQWRVKEKVRTGFKVSPSKSRVCHHLFCSKWIFTWLQWILLSIITLFLWSALLFKAAAAFIHHLCYWLNVSWPAGGSSLVIIRHYGCILKAYSPLAAEARNGDVTSEARRF